MAEPGPAAALAVRLRIDRRDPRHPPFTVEAELTVGPGVTALVGPSGAGKSTLLGAIAGLLPGRGHVALGEEVWLDEARGEVLPVEARRIALVFQSLALFPHLTALGNVEYGIPRTLPRPARRARALELLARMRVLPLAQRRPGTLSGGEAQRVALARAFAMAPRLLLLDEAFSAIDRPARHELLAEVRRYVDEQALPALLVTHHLADARRIADRAILLAQGKVVREGSAAAVLDALDSDEWL